MGARKMPKKKVVLKSNSPQGDIFVSKLRGAVTSGYQSPTDFFSVKQLASTFRAADTGVSSPVGQQF